MLLAQLKNKDHKAALTLIEEHYKQVYYFLFKLCKDKETAQDLTQETFIKVWDKIESFNGNSRFSTWIYRISYNIFIDYTRMNKLNTITIDDPELYSAIECVDKVNDKVYLKLEYETIKKAVDNLSDKYKEVILMYYEDDLSYQEISIILNIPKGTVKSRINGGISELRNKLKVNY